MTDQKSISPRAWTELLLLALIWGGSFLSVRAALDELPVVTTVLHRTLWAMLALWGVVWLMRLPLPRDPGTWRAFLVMGLLNNVVPFGLLSWGQLHIESGLTAILNGTTAIFGVIVAAAAFPDERLTLRKIVGVGLGFTGVATAIGLDQFARFDIRSTAQLAILGATFSYALAGAWARKRMGHLPPQVAAAGMLTASTLMLLPTALLIDGPLTFDLQPTTWGALAYLSLAATAGAYLLYYRVLAMAGSGNLMLVTLLIPPVAIILGAWGRDESLAPNAFAGLGILAAGLLILNGTLWPRR
ncbi:DMT family transporter [Jhaorihella thermophila]|uniref:Permease of the drug/metabolite transporter (DMT) superfamily n=1 Tax=Jhaorihella thermophila TaxID=488547 RepID=A0A1H5RPH4_9RHOB|nr:DMT family transporter [Jhaorihella thermophila]SEF40263.1 Permease of the drug/metabolite transporter (DMT) superfamily [Jhaorihella thermophila]